MLIHMFYRGEIIPRYHVVTICLPASRQHLDYINIPHSIKKPVKEKIHISHQRPTYVTEICVSSVLYQLLLFSKLFHVTIKRLRSLALSVNTLVLDFIKDFLSSENFSHSCSFSKAVSLKKCFLLSYCFNIFMVSIFYPC